MAGKDWTAEDIPDLTGKIAVVTGASSGLGAETARVLGARGARVIMGVRDLDKGERVVAAIRARHPDAQVEVQRLDLASLALTKRFAQGTRTRLTRLDLLIANAAEMVPPGQREEPRTQDGFELQFGTNHLGHFALIGHLLPLLEATRDARIVVVGSQAYRRARLDLEDLNWRDRAYRPARAYRDSKIANLHFTAELVRRLGRTGPRVTVALPGLAVTGLQRHAAGPRMLARALGQGTGAAAAPILRAAFDPAARPGEWFAPDGLLGLRGAPVAVTPAARADDPETAKRLWNRSEALTGVTY
ncbi:MAG: SDR family NAD(P)-dependent oxidoreductase [Maritimibacter sp.]|nr:SDR family NAD(P)-dependent oxidoreductase [Maritimibacter sp.]